LRVRALEGTIRALPCRDCIVDGELYGVTLDLDGEARRRPATVYDILRYAEGAPERPIRLHYAAFDLLFMNGVDLTDRPLRERRAALSALVQPLRGAPLPVPIELAEGQLATSVEEVNRRFQYFRNQGHEGIICKDFEGPYRIATRDPTWVKRKPEVTLDLVLTAGVFAVTTKATAGMFGSYALGARRSDGSFEDVGDVAGLDVERDRAIQNTIAFEGLIMGRTERPSSSGVRPGLELRPHLVATIKFEGVVKDAATQRLSLRDPKIATLRPDKSASEASTIADIEALYRKERLG
jgi:DNA ligase-1